MVDKWLVFVSAVLVVVEVSPQDEDGRNPAPVDRWFIDLSHYV
jgi:hypothetical protein